MIWLVVSWIWDFPIFIYGMSSFHDELIFFKMVKTTNQWYFSFSSENGGSPIDPLIFSRTGGRPWQAPWNPGNQVWCGRFRQETTTNPRPLGWKKSWRVGKWQLQKQHGSSWEFGIGKKDDGFSRLDMATFVWQSISVEILKVEGIPWSISAGLWGHCEQVSICEESRLGAWEMERKVIHEP